MSRCKELTPAQMQAVAAALDIAAEKYLGTAENLSLSFPGDSMRSTTKLLVEELQRNAADALELAADFRTAAPVILSLPNDTLDELIVSNCVVNHSRPR